MKNILIKRLVHFARISIFKTLRFNFHYFKFTEALKIPVLVYKGVELYNMRGGWK